MITWFRNWRQARREQKIFDALFLLALMDSEPTPCAVCNDDCEECVCGELDCE